MLVPQTRVQTSLGSVPLRSSPRHNGFWRMLSCGETTAVHTHGFSARFCPLLFEASTVLLSVCLSARQTSLSLPPPFPLRLASAPSSRGSTASEYPTRSCPACCKPSHKRPRKGHRLQESAVGALQVQHGGWGFDALRAASAPPSQLPQYLPHRRSTTISGTTRESPPAM